MKTNEIFTAVDNQDGTVSFEHDECHYISRKMTSDLFEIHVDLIPDWPFGYDVDGDFLLPANIPNRSQADEAANKLHKWVNDCNKVDKRWTAKYVNSFNSN